MGIVQLNAFLAWCKDAMDCKSALSGKDEEDSENERDSSSEIGERGFSSRAEGSKGRTARGTTKLCGLLQLEVFARWFKQRMERTRDYLCRNTENGAHIRATHE